MSRAITALLIAITLAGLLAAQSLSVRIDGDQLHVAAARLHFIAGEALSRLHDGATVKYEIELTIRTGRNSGVSARSQERFSVSYDLWEEKFAVTKLGPPARSVSHLTAAAAETWCLDSVSIPVAAVASSQPFWIRLDYRAEEYTEAGGPTDNSGFTLSSLIDIFSRRTRSEPVKGFEEIGPLRLDALKRR